MGQIVTFYSYKGGTGRSMALANIGVLLAQWGYSVLMIDWDLEAPGLEYYFKNYIPDFRNIKSQKGIIDLISGHIKKERIFDWKELVLSIKIKDIENRLSLLTSGTHQSEYFDNLKGIYLREFYSEYGGGQYIESLRDEWKQSYDFILVDSRTGISDIGGICTIQLPDTLVLMFTTNEQSFDGILSVAQKAKIGQQRLPSDRLSLFIIPVPSRIDLGEFVLTQNWYSDISKQFKEIYAEWLNNPQDLLLKQMVENTKIPYIPYFSFGEKLAVLEQGTNDPNSLGYSYENIAALIANNLYSANRLLEDREQFIRSAYEKEAAMDHDKHLHVQENEEYLNTKDFSIFVDENLRRNAYEAVDQFLRHHDLVDHSQLHSIPMVIRAGGYSALRDMIENQKKKNTKKKNKEFWEFLYELIINPIPTFSLRYNVHNYLKIQNLLYDETKITDTVESKKIKRKNKEIIDKVVEKALPIFFEHFNYHYFYQSKLLRNQQGAVK